MAMMGCHIFEDEALIKMTGMIKIEWDGQEA
jgi:hypothetical protein